MPGPAQARPPVTLGLPGVYRMAAPQTRTLPAVPMDVAGFLGLAERGPAWQPDPEQGLPEGGQLGLPGGRLCRTVPVAVESFDDFRRQFGEGSGGGNLAAAVRAYFEQGARRAWVARLMPRRAQPMPDRFADCARGELPGIAPFPLVFHARNPGSWGDRIVLRLALRRSRLAPATEEVAPGPDLLVFDASTPVAIGATLLIDGALFRRVTGVQARPRGRIPGAVRQVQLDGAVPAAASRIELIEIEAAIEDGGLVRESYSGLGLDPAHPTWLARVLARQSALVWPDPAWSGLAIVPGLASLERSHVATFRGGSDAGNRAVVPEDNFDPDLGLEASQADGCASGVQALLAVAEVAHVCLPDLYHPQATPVPVPPQPAPGRGARFRDCTPEPEAQPLAEPPAVPGLEIDPATADGRARILALQHKLVDICEASGQAIALIDAPPGLSAERVAAWRGAFASPFAALYAPWCRMVRRDNRDGGLADVPPSAVAAGLVAASERLGGVARGPANLVAREVVALTDLYPAEALGPLHQSGVNLFTTEVDGIRLQGARTASHAPYDRQLNVRRMVLRLMRMLREGLQWAVFEPSQPMLWERVAALLEVMLREEWRRGGFAGATPEASYFINIDRSPGRLDRGELVVSVGVALVEPLEFILLRLTRAGDGTLNLEAAA